MSENNNILINGTFGIWQRTLNTTAAAGAYTYGPDRWVVLPAGGTVNIGRAPLLGEDIPERQGEYDFSMYFPTGVSGYIMQFIEAEVVNQCCLTDSLTFSCWLHFGNYEVTPRFVAKTPTARDNWTSASDGIVRVLNTCYAKVWTKVSYTFHPLQIKDIDKGLYVAIYIPAVAQNTNVDMAMAKLERGYQATPIEPRHNELVLCQRYFEIFTPKCAHTVPNLSAAYRWSYTHSWNTPKRVTPTITQKGIYVATNVTTLYPNCDLMTKEGCRVYLISSGAASAGTMYLYPDTGGVPEPGYVEAKAEIV